VSTEEVELMDVFQWSAFELEM